jgi:transcriptional regulator GlxA family with amidase domain
MATMNSHFENRSRPTSELNVGIILLPNFTMVALAGFVDTLRLAADEGDRSRQIRCSWHIMTEDREAVRASNAIAIQPSTGLSDFKDFDYLVVVGGTLHSAERESEALLGYINRAAASGITLIGLCNGVFALARAGLMHGRRACVSWFHHEDYLAEFPDHEVVSDRMFLVDGNRITCPGGVCAIHLASWLIERHLGKGAASKGLRIMLEEAARPGEAPQPGPTVQAFSAIRDLRVRRAVLAMERLLDQNIPLPDLARLVGSTPRNLTRLFVGELGVTPKGAMEAMRMAKAKRLILDGNWSIAEIAAQCGFSDASHLIRRFRTIEGMTPGQVKQQRRTKSELSASLS